MIQKTFVLIALLAIAQSRSVNSVVLYEGARLIPGDGGQPIEGAAMLVQNGVITERGTGEPQMTAIEAHFPKPSYAPNGEGGSSSGHF